MSNTKTDVTYSLPDGWRIVRLGDVAEVVMGQSPPGSTVFELDSDNQIDTGLPFIQGNAEFGDYFPHPVKWCVKPRKTAEPGDTLISVRAPVGDTNRAIETIAIGRGLVAVRFTAVDPDFGWHAINLAKVELERVRQGTTFDAIGKKDIANLTIPIPPIDQQRKIAEVLDSIDDAIERTEGVICATEQVRDALLYELLSRGMPGWHREWRDVPGVGTLPASWDVVRFGDVAEVRFSPVDKKSVDDEVPVRLCNYTDVYYNRVVRSGMEFMVATATQVECEKWSLKRGDVLFTKDSETPDDIGVPAYVSEDMPDVLCGYHLGLARPQQDMLDGVFLAEFLSSWGSRREFARIANGVTRFGLTLDATRALPITLPPVEEQRAICGVLNSIDDSLECLRAERDSMAVLKGSVADGLLTGRVRVPVVRD